MHKKIFIFLVFLPSIIYAHSLLLDVYDNEDNTITVSGSFSSGEPAIGALIKLKSQVSGRVLYKKRLPNENELTIEIPKEPYKIILDGGPGHTIIKDGIAPENGYSKVLLEKEEKNKEENKENKNEENENMFSSETLIGTAFSFSLILFFITILIANKNTNKLIKELNSLKK